MKIEVHILQNFAPACLNRDDTNTPKDCMFGGYRRARISSQCIKRAVRWHSSFRDCVEATFGRRSNQHARQIAQLLAEATDGPKPFDEALQVGRYLFQRMGFKEKNGRLTVMILLGDDEIKAMARVASANWDLLAPLANASLLWERLAEKITGLLADQGSDAEMLGRLVANHRAGSSTASQLARWLDVSEEAWADALEAVRALPEDFRQELRAKFAAGSEADDGEAADDEYVPAPAAKLFKGRKNKRVTDALNDIKIGKMDDRSGSGPGKEEAGKRLNQLFEPLKKLTTKAVDVAMFGRMVAEIKSGDMNVDAACQVAHAISTHHVDTEMDFFSAVEDLKDLARIQGVEQNAGAGMLGTVDFNSACFYRYANIDFDQLKKNLQGDVGTARQAVRAFLEAAVKAIPTGKQNSMAAHSLPSLVLAVVRDRGLASLANAFVDPVRPDGTGSLVAHSVRRLDQYWGTLARMYGTDGIRKIAICTEDDGRLKHLKDHALPNCSAVFEAVLGDLPGGAS